MSKKNLLNEQTIRRFGGIAGIKPATTSNFLHEEFEEIEDVEVEEEVPDIDADLDDLEAAEDDLEAAEDDLEADVEVDAEQLVLDIVTDVQALADLAGVTVDIDDTDEDLGGIDDVEVDEFPVEDIGVEEEEEEVSLEEMINSILEEDDDEDLLEEEEEELEEKKRSDKTIHQKTGPAFKAGQKTKGGKKAFSTKKTSKRLKTTGGPDDDSWGDEEGEKPYNESRQKGRIQVVDDEYLMKEVSRRVKTRLANLVKEQRRRKRPIKRKK